MAFARNSSFLALALSLLVLGLGSPMPKAAAAATAATDGKGVRGEGLELLHQALAEIAELRKAHTEQREEIESLRTALEQQQANEEAEEAEAEARRWLLERRLLMEARHLEQSGRNLTNYSGVSVRKEEAMVTLGPEMDIKLVRSSYGKLMLLADEVHIAGKLFVDGVEINADCCSDSGPIYTTGVLFNFSDCSGDGWNNTESPFEVTSASDTWVQKIPSYLDSEYDDILIGFDDDDCQFNSYIAGETATGVTASDAFYITRNKLSFWSVGFTSGTCNNRLGAGISSYVAVVNAEDESDVWATTSELGGTGSALSDGDYWIRHEFDLSDHRGKIGRIVMVDAMSGTSCSWFAVDDFSWVPESESSKQESDGIIYRKGALFNFSDCTATDWNTTGNFQVVDASGTWVYKAAMFIDSDYSSVKDTFIIDSNDCEFNSYVGGESKTGTALSEPFYVTADTLSFWSVGFTSGSCSNRLGKVTTSYVSVVNADDESDVWATTSALGGTGSSYSDGDYWIRTSFDLSDYVGEVARIKLRDGMSGSGCSWFSVDDFTMP